MCYSAMVKQDLKELKLGWKVRMDMDLILDLFQRRSKGEKLSIPKAFEANFDKPKTPEEKKIHKIISEYRTNLISELESDIFAQKTRQNKAIEALKTKVTKKNENERDVAGRQIERFKKQLDKLKDTKPRDNDSRIYAFNWAPVIVLEDGERVVKPMRYHLRPSFATEKWDRDFGGCYNARRDKLSSSWKSQFGKNHGLIIVTSFFENVALHDFEQRKLKKGEEEQNLVIQFKPRGMDYMVVPCIWDHWGDKKTGFDSFALITDDPPDEVLAAGHDRCPIFLNEARIDDWLNPRHKTAAELFDVLNDRSKPFYEHSKAG